MTTRNILLTGGLGYIGSHTAIALCEAGYTPIIVDNLSNSRREVLEGIATLCGFTPPFEQGDCANPHFVDKLFQTHAPFLAVIHFAALKAVGESVRKPLEYYCNNIGSLLQILKAMGPNCLRLVFSSSASVYGQPSQLPVTELTPLQPPTSPYGATKLFSERIIEDALAANPNLSARTPPAASASFPKANRKTYSLTSRKPRLGYGRNLQYSATTTTPQMALRYAITSTSRISPARTS